MKASFAGLTNRISTLEINSQQCLQLIADALKTKGFAVDDTMVLCIKPTYHNARERNHELEIARFSEDFKGKRPKS